MRDAADIRIARLAPASSELGLLQRGRGEGFLAALAMSREDARELVWHCIVNDPRWDLQVETRAPYYANLAVQLELDLERLRPAGCPEPSDDLDQRLVVDVLAELESMGVGEAGAALIDHVASGHEYDNAIYAVSRASGQLYRQLPEVLESRFDVTERCDIVRRWRREIPWNELVEGHPWIAQAIEPNDDVARPGPTEDPPPSMDRSAAELLGHPWRGVTPKRLLHRLISMLRSGEREALVAALLAPGSARWIALQALARLDDPGGVPAAERIIRDGRSGRERAEAMRYVSGLSAEHTLELARGWATTNDDRAVAALMILERHAEPLDQPYLAARLTTAWAERDFYALCSCIDAMARLRGPGTADLIATIYEEAEYSYARRRAARALVAIDPMGFSDRFARAALWDCEAEVQELAVERVPQGMDDAAIAQIRTIDRSS